MSGFNEDGFKRSPSCLAQGDQLALLIRTHAHRAHFFTSTQLQFTKILTHSLTLLIYGEGFGVASTFAFKFKNFFPMRIFSSLIEDYFLKFLQIYFAVVEAGSSCTSDCLQLIWQSLNFSFSCLGLLSARLGTQATTPSKVITFRVMI